MGKSQKIQDAISKDQEFNAFLKQKQNECLPIIEGSRRHLDERITDFHRETPSGYITIAEGEKWEYHLSSEVGFSALKSRLTEMINSVFGATTTGQWGKIELEKTEDGSISMDLSDSVIDALNQASGYKNMAAAAVHTFVFSTLDVFGSKPENTDTHNCNSQSLVPGLGLHIYSYTTSYANERFFHCDKIVATHVQFKLTYSYSLAQSTSKSDCIVKLQDSLFRLQATLQATQKELVDAIMAMRSDTMEAVDIQQKRCKMLEELCEESRKALESLSQ